jgi:hypothetical protein
VWWIESQASLTQLRNGPLPGKEKAWCVSNHEAEVVTEELKVPIIEETCAIWVRE